MVAWHSWAPSYCDLHSERVACARSGRRCHCDSQAVCGLRARWRRGRGCDLQSGRGAMSRRACPVLSRRSRRVVSRQVISGHVMLRRSAVSCLLMSHHVIFFMSCHVASCYVALCHFMSCRVMSLPVLSHCVASRRDQRPQHIDTATSLSHYANVRRSHSHSSYRSR